MTRRRSRILKPTLVKAALKALIVLTAFYLCTASLGFEGPGETLVFRPFHGLYPHYFVLDPDSSRLAVYHGILPWWQTGSYITLFSTSHETTTALWLIVYFLGYYATALGWLALGSTLIVRVVRRSRQGTQISPARTWIPK